VRAVAVKWRQLFSLEKNMHDDYKKAILDQLDDMLQSGIMHSTNYTVMLMVRDKLIAKGLDAKMAEHIVTKAQIVVHDDIYADRAFMDQVIDKYTEVIVEMHKFATTKLINDEFFEHLVEGLNLVLVPQR
jgi:hypothetical protein